MKKKVQTVKNVGGGGEKLRNDRPSGKKLQNLRGEFAIGQIKKEVFLDTKQIIWYWWCLPIQDIDARLAGRRK